MKGWTCVVLLCVTAVLADDDWLEVEIEQGVVRGRRHPSGHLYAFYNIPYATGPEGVKKFKAPLPPPTWSETFNATDDKNIVCPQGKDILQIIENVEMKEDCLIANVFVPDTTKKNFSVLVYVHGGGFILGFGNYYQGTEMMRTKDFIMVTFNYRLGAHGFLCLGTEDIPGNAGMKDQVALLSWVQKNIAKFGGNPDDVTLAGYSAGSASVDLMMLSKAAEGLFHRVIPESGGNLAAFTVQRDPLKIAKTLAKELNGLAIVDDINSLEQFYKTTTMEMLTKNTRMFAERPDSTFLFSPCVESNIDGAFLTESPLSILKRGDFKKLPMLYGFTNMEGLLRIEKFNKWKEMMNDKFSDFLPADLNFESDAQREEVARIIKKFYFGDDPVRNDNILKYVDYFTDVFFTHPVLWAAKLQIEAGNDQVYLYEYSFVDKKAFPVSHTNVRGAEHCAQSLAWLDNPGGQNESFLSLEYQEMRKTVREIWHNFIKTGKPIPEGWTALPAWPAAGVNRSPHMVLNETVVLSGVLLEDRTRFWEGIYEKYYQDSVPPNSLAQKNIINLFIVSFLFILT